MEFIDRHHFIAQCSDRDITVGSFCDNGGVHGLSAFDGNKYAIVIDDGSENFHSFIYECLNKARSVSCWDSRELATIGASLALDSRLIHDVRLLYGGNEDLTHTAHKHLGSGGQDLIARENQFAANIRAAKTTGLSIDAYSIMRLVPRNIVCGLLSARLNATRQLYELKLQTGLGDYESVIWPFARALQRVESNKIRIDEKYVRKMSAGLDEQTAPASESRFFKTVLEQLNSGYVTTKFNPCGGKTGRVKVLSGFNCMGIPRGAPRQALISRHNGGMIYVFDFNAIDYRCIVQSVEDKTFRDLYAGADDFHTRTVELLFGKGNVNDLRRKIVKAFTYVYIYGGSEKTLSSKTGLSVKKVKDIMERINCIFKPITLLKNELYNSGMRDGYIRHPGGRNVKIEKDDHCGKILGLYAQSFSSYIFEQAFMSAEKILRNKKSKIIFTVHDELVIDFHPDEFAMATDVISAMEHATEYEFRVKMKKGKDYCEATN